MDSAKVLIAMKVAIPTWNAWVSPVFDVARQVVLVDLEGGKEVTRRDVAITETGPIDRARRVKELGVTVLICGAISRPLEAMIVSEGVHVIAQTCGPTEEVLQAY